MLINNLLNIKYPIIQGAMARISNAQFAADVSNCGALGMIASATMDKNMVEKAILKCRSLTDKPFGVNLMLMNPHSADIVKILCELKPAVVITGAGNPRPYIQRLKDAGIVVIPIVPTVALAQRMESSGADMIIVEGTEAGGHVGESTTLTLLPQVVDAVSIPVIAAGGIADGRGIMAALALGASGVQIATVLLASKECPVHDNYKQAIIQAKDNDTTLTGRSLSAPIRLLKNALTQEYQKLESTGATQEVLEQLTINSLSRAVEQGDLQHGSMMMGQIAGLVKEIRPLQQIFDLLMTDTVTQHIKVSKIMDELTNIKQ